MPSTAPRPVAEVLVHALLEPVVADAGFDLDSVSVSVAGRRSVVRVVVDADGGIDLDDVATVSRAISEALDAADPDVLAAAYVLEVSSPGVDRRLTEPKHWRRAKGRLVTVDVAGSPVTARVVDADESGVQVETNGTVTRHGWAELGPGRIQVEFSHAGDGPAEDGYVEDEEG